MYFREKDRRVDIESTMELKWTPKGGLTFRPTLDPHAVLARDYLTRGERELLCAWAIGSRKSTLPKMLTAASKLVELEQRAKTYMADGGLLDRDFESEIKFREEWTAAVRSLAAECSMWTTAADWYYGMASNRVFPWEDLAQGHSKELIRLSASAKELAAAVTVEKGAAATAEATVGGEKKEDQNAQQLQPQQQQRAVGGAATTTQPSAVIPTVEKVKDGQVATQPRQTVRQQDLGPRSQPQQPVPDTPSENKEKKVVAEAEEPSENKEKKEEPGTTGDKNEVKNEKKESSVRD